MSIITDALKKVADKRKDIIESQEEKIVRGLANEIRRMARKKIKWSMLSSLGAFFIIGFGVVIFLYNLEFLHPAISPIKITALPMAIPQKIGTNHQIKETFIDKPKKEKVLLPSLSLNGIIKGDGEPLAVIDNKIVKRGDFIQGAQVINIAADGVTLLYHDKEITLRIQ